MGSFWMPFGHELPVRRVFPNCGREQEAKDVINVVIVIYDDISSIKHRVKARTRGICNPYGFADVLKQISLTIKDKDQAVSRQPADKDSAVAQNAYGLWPIGRKGTEKLSIDRENLYQTRVHDNRVSISVNRKVLRETQV